MAASMNKHCLTISLRYFQNLCKISAISCSTISECNRKDVFHISTPIYYVNAAPHMGHLYTSLLADAACRWKSLQNHKVKFVTGTDEHGLKIERAAESSEQPVHQYCDSVSEKYKDMFSAFDIKHTDFIRTTSSAHKQAVTHFWEKISPHLSKGLYSGWYCTNDEAFLTDGQVEEVEYADGVTVMVSRESGHPCERIQEENYMFPLHRYKDDIRSWIDSSVITPALFKSSLSRSLDNVSDLSVSRSSDRLSWGIPVPNDPTQRIYVWLDALVNYLTACGYPDQLTSWPVDYHLVGKDILKFHAIYWPAFLMAADLPLPKGIICHSHWLVDDRKMSKSVGNVVDPMEVKEMVQSDGLRYFLLREGVLSHDGNYSEGKMVACLNTELCNTLGNILSRCTSLLLNPDQIFPNFDLDLYKAVNTERWDELLHGLRRLPEEVGEHYNRFEFYKGVSCIMSQLRLTDGFIESTAPWKLKQEKEMLNLVLHIVMENLRVAGILLQPIIPNVSKTLLDRLGITESCRGLRDVLPASLHTDVSPALGPVPRPALFPRILTPRREPDSEPMYE